MSYEPTEWKDGDVVTSAKLNKIENALTEICSPYFIISFKEDSEWEMNRTWQETMDAFNAGKILLYVTYQNNAIKTVSFCRSIDINGKTITFYSATLFAEQDDDYLTMAD